jgi:hypothetical protein
MNFLKRHRKLRDKIKRVLRRLGLLKIASGNSISHTLVRQPSNELGRLIICGFGLGGFGGRGKVQPRLFFPDFCTVLAREGISTIFASTAQQLSRLVTKDSVVIHIYSEEIGDRLPDRIDTDHVLNAQRRALLIFNHPSIGPIIGRKDETHRLFTQNGIHMPSKNVDSGTVFSISPYGSGTGVKLFDDKSKLDTDNHNTSYIDTRVNFGDQQFHTSVRLLCVGREIVHAFVRARNTKDGSPSVHSRNTPTDPELLEFLHTKLVNPHIAKFQLLAKDVATVLGLGFYVHDLLVEKQTGKIFICETGFKFHDWTYVNHISSISDSLPSHHWMPTPECARKSAEAFLKECRRYQAFDF